MQWSELYGNGHEPLNNQIREFVATPLWDDLANHLQQTYNAQPKLFYSCCSMDKGFWKGWNVKYKKSGKALCTFYPKQGYFVALIAVGVKEIAKADLLIPLCDKYTQNLYNRVAWASSKAGFALRPARTEFGTVGKSLAVEVRNENILRDVKNLIALRVGAR